MNAQIDGEYVCRTGAQKAALEAGYGYDVRTTIDGFPILLFYRPTKNDDVIFIGKYNFNNDKSTESVFGFEGIPGFDNSKMQCWEVLNNGNALALFTSTEGFDENWAEAFESRYPDTSKPYTGDLKAFCEWMTNVSQEDFATQKWEHLNVYMMAAYWVYLMRHAAADQFVKNAMFTTEDGQHFYYILYDNDTINGLINTGRLRIKPTDDRQTVDETGSYVFAGHDSRLWNMLEADEEFKSIVSDVDNALYSAGISYANTIRVFDEEQADKWVEKVYNQDAQYKYVGPFNEKGIDNLFMLQGKRDLHRRWWLAKRFSIYDAKYVSGTYKSQAVELKCLNGTPAGQRFSVKAGYPLDYGFGINNVPREFGISLNPGESHTFTTREVVNLGDPIRIYGAPNIAELDLSPMASRLAVITVANVYDESLGTKLTKLVVGGQTNAEVSEISGLKQASALEHLDIQGMTKMSSLDLSSHAYFKTLKAFGSGISSVSFAKGAPVERLELPSTMRVLSLEQLPYLKGEDIILEDIAGLSSISIKSCPNVSNDFDFVHEWYTSKTTEDSRCSLAMDNVNWHMADADAFMQVLNIKTSGGTFSVKGKVRMDSIRVEQIYAIRDILGESSFDPNAEFYVDIPSILQINAEDSVLEGNSLQFTTSLYPMLEGTYTWSLETGRMGCSIDQNGLLTTEETALDTSDVVVKVRLVTNDGEVLTATKTVSVVRRTYPQDITIIGSDNPIEKPNTYTWSTTTEGVNGDFYARWNLSGDITSVVEIVSQDNEMCVMGVIKTPSDIVLGVLTLTIYRTFDDSPVIITTKELEAMMEGVVITDKTNPVIQAALHSNGLVANAAYSLKEEVALITAQQLYDALYPLSSSNKDKVIQFDELQYFTGLTEIKSNTFYRFYNMESIIIPSSVISIETSAFYQCGLKNINIPEGVTTIGSYAFSYGYSLETIIISDSVTHIGNKVFEGQPTTSLVVVGRGVTSFGKDAFSGCNGTLELNCNTPDASGLYTGVFNGSKFTVVNIGNSVQRIGSYTFADCSTIEELTLPDGLTHIGDAAFYCCQGLKSITIPDSVTSMGSTVFAYNHIEKIIIGDIRSLGAAAFFGCKDVKEIICLGKEAPATGDNQVFGASESSFVGRNSYDMGTNFIYVQSDATGYETGLWLDPLCNPSKCGFTLSKTL